VAIRYSLIDSSVKNSARALEAVLPRPILNLTKRVLMRQRPPVWGNLRRQKPFSDYWGFDRGLPVDRFYIESFLSRHAETVRGRVLEVRDRRYTHRFGGADVTASDVVDIDPQNEDATIVTDLAVRGSLPEQRFDCIILTSTLQYVDDPAAAVGNVWSALAPGGTLLLTVPCLQRIDPDTPDVDRWRVTPNGLAQLFRGEVDGGDVEVVGCGNLLASTAFLLGLSAEELRPSELEYNDPDFPLVACARVRRPA
jgi:SAM-dependent methyltransferase